MKKYLPLIIGLVLLAGSATAGILLPSKEISFGAVTTVMPNQGGTGTSTKPTTGQVLMGNVSGTYSVVATSSLGIVGFTSPLTTKGDIFTWDTTNARLASGTPGYLLAVSSTASTGLEWVSTSSLGITADSLWTESGNVIVPTNANDAINVASTTGGYKYANTRFITFVNNNLSIGESALETATGQYNLGIGSTALWNTTTGTYNVAIGTDAMRSNLGGNYNYANGYQALYSNIDGQYNTAVGGSAALRSNSSGNYNVAMGDSSCYTNETGNNNTCVGYNSDVASAALSSSTAIGYNAEVSASGTIVLGNTATKVGIASTSANYTLDVAGDINTNGTYRINSTDYGQYFINSAGSNGEIWTSDGSGRGGWAAASGGGDLTFATQQAWTATFTAYYVSATSITTTLATQAVASTTAGEIENKLMRWTNADNTSSSYGWVKSVSQAGTVLTLTINGNPIYAADTNFRVSRQHEVQKFHWYIPGQCVADATNPVGVVYSIPTTSIYFLSLDGVLMQPNTSTLTVNLYQQIPSSTVGQATSLFSTAPDFGANVSVINNAQFTTSTVSGQALVTLRTPACGSGGNGADMDIWAYYMKSNWQEI